jgi:hypothetical protein
MGDGRLLKGVLSGFTPFDAFFGGSHETLLAYLIFNVLMDWEEGLEGNVNVNVTTSSI